MPLVIGFGTAVSWSLSSEEPLVASLLLVAMPGSSFLFLVVRPGAPSSVLAPSSDARSP